MTEEQKTEVQAPAAVKKGRPFVYRWKTTPIFTDSKPEERTTEVDVLGVEYYVPLIPDGPVQKIGGMQMRFSKHGELDRTQLVVMLSNNHSIRVPLGDRSVLDSHLRVLSDQDRHALDAYDEEIAALRRMRAELLAAAFKRGAKPNAYELALMADANLPKQQEQLARNHAAQAAQKKAAKSRTRK